MQATAWLPTKAGVPLASSQLIAERPRSQAKSNIAPYTLTTIALSTEETVDLLSLCMGKQILAPGVVVGRDLMFWAQTLRFVGSLVARQQFLPGLTEKDGTYRALWEPVFAGDDAERLAKLAKEMPAVARALSNDKTISPPELPSQLVLSGFFAELTLHLVRTAILKKPPPARPRRGREKKSPTFDSIHDHWLYALRAPDGVMEGDENDLAQLAMQIGEWRRPISIFANSPFRLCFRLEEPEGEESIENSRVLAKKAVEDKWYLRYLLQAVDDPSLMVGVEDAWKSRGRKASVLKRGGLNPKEFVLSSLGQALSICPLIEESLKTPTPSGCDLDTVSAHEFLTEKALVLQQAGFGVMLPAWWTRKGTKVRLSLRAKVKSPRMSGSRRLSLEQIMKVDWEVALGGEKLALQELRALAKLKAPLVKLRGQWVELRSEEIQAALDFWKKKAIGSATVSDIVQMSLGAIKTVGEIALGGVEATGWVADLVAQLEGRAVFEELSTPQNFQGTLRPYQVRGYSWLAFLQRWGLGACLADDMGLGKTIQALAMIQRDWESNGNRPVLLICPTSVLNNWQKEAARFTPQLPVMVHHGIARKKGPVFKKVARKQAIVITSYALLYRDLDHLKKVDWLGVILDEAQNIKNPETKQTRAARFLRADYRIALTGTPVENNVGDLWSIIEFLNPGFLGTQAEFKRTFFIPIQASRDPEAAEKLKRITAPFILRRLKTDKSIIADLPEKMEMKVFCTLTREQASLYAAVVKEAEEVLESAEGIQRKGMILGTLSKLKQVCNHPLQFLGDNSRIPGRSGKLARLAEMIEEIMEVGDKALIFSQFAEMGAILKRHLQETFGREALFLYGAVPKKKRDQMVERFQADGDGPRIFILSLKAGGIGLNLTAACHVFHFDRWWNPAVEDQATDRAFRIGQTKDVQVHKLLCAGTLEEKIDEMIEHKKNVAEKVIGKGEGWLTELSNAEIKEIFALRKEAVGE
jgi:SNF2 family DNA or RNA helicase